MHLSLREVAEFEGEGLLTCLCVYDGACYVGCERGTEGLYAVSGEGFAAVELPLDEVDTAYVQELIESDGLLWAFGWLVGLDAGGAVEEASAAIWSFDGSDWTLRSRVEAGPEANQAMRWAGAAALSDRIVTGTYSWDVYDWADKGGAWDGQVIDGALLRPAQGRVQVLAAAALSGRPVRITRSAGMGWSIDGCGQHVVPYAGAPDPDWGDFWHPLQPLVRWLGRVWFTAEGAAGRQQLHSTDGASTRPGPSWLMQALGCYDVLTVWQNRLVLFGHDGAYRPAWGYWDPPGVALGRPIGDWRVRLAREYGETLWCLGTQGTRSSEHQRPTSPKLVVARGNPAAGPPGDAVVGGELCEIRDVEGGVIWVSGYTSPWRGYYLTAGSYNGHPYYVKADGRPYLIYALARQDRQAVLVAAGEVSAHAVTLEWADGSGDHRPELQSTGLEWSRAHPTQVSLGGVALEWSDGGGEHSPLLHMVGLSWSDNKGVFRPDLLSAELEWSKGGDQRPGLASVVLEWSDGSGGNRPALLSAEVSWGDGSGGNRPALLSAEVDWADHGPQPPRSAVAVTAYALEWNDDADPTAEAGSGICWLTLTTGRPVVGVRVVTSAAMEEGRELDCLIRCDDVLPVDAWASYQRFRSNRTVLVDAPGTDLRVGVVKPAEVADETDLIVQLQYEE